LCAAAVFTGVAAGFASLRLVGESFFFVEILLTRGEQKFLSTVFANDSFVLMDQL